MTAKTKKSSNTNGKFLALRIIIFVVLCVVTIVCGVVFKQPIENALNKKAHSSTETLDQAGLTAYFVDVGQGDGIAIRFPDGKTMLVDAGPRSSADNLVEYLKNNFFEPGQNKFDYLLLTHSDEDHCGGMVKVCEQFEVETIFRPHIYSKYNKNNINFDETNGNAANKTICQTQVYYKTISAFYSETSNVFFTDVATMNTTHKIEGANYSIDFYYPTTNYITSSMIDGEGTVENNYSPIMVLSFNGKKIMLTGDISVAGEQMAMAQNTLPDVDVLKVAHHGSASSTGSAFLAQTKPEHSVICCGQNNKYNHPTTEALNRIMACGSQIYRTDTNGNVVVNITTEQVASINIFFDTVNTAVYIQVEYLMGGIILLGIFFCFGKKVKLK